MTPRLLAPKGPTTDPGGAEWGGEAGSGPILGADFRLDERNIATEPPEVARVARRDQVRLMISAGQVAPRHAVFHQLPETLTAGDVLVVNNSATVAAAVDATVDGQSLVLHVSSQLPGRLVMVEPRLRLANGSTEPLTLAGRGRSAVLADGSTIELLHPAPGSIRLWLAQADGGGRTASGAGPMGDLLNRLGRPIRYRYVPRDWPLAYYQTIFSSIPGSAEMPSAARPFTPELVARLVARGIGFATITLHTGVSSLEGHERPYPEQFEVPAFTAAAVNAAHVTGRHVIAVGTTVVRALETAADSAGVVHPTTGWTDLVIGASRGVRVVDGLVTGWHEPEASHLAMLESVAGRQPLVTAYNEALAAGYRWHEFGDSHLLLAYDRPAYDDGL